MILFVKLLIAHLLADFVFQPEGWVREKELRKHRSPKLYLHVLIHGILTMLLVWDWKFWPPVLVIMITHYLIDLAKVKFQQTKNRKYWFFADQLSHLTVLTIVWFAWERPSIPLESLTLDPDVLLFMAGFIFLSSPASVIIKMLISQWTPDTIHTVGASLPDAGKFIGILERLLVFIFIINNHWEAVGFLLAAKSVFRFGNLKESYDRKLTEYVLIGTLLSFGIALIISILVAAILNDRVPDLFSIMRT